MADGVKEYLDTVKRMEPDIHPVDQDGAAASIAISLKRGADALERIADALTPQAGENHLTLADIAWDWFKAYEGRS